MSIVEQILKVRDSQVGWFDGYELRKIAEEVHKLEEISEVRLAYIGQLESNKKASIVRIKHLEDIINRAHLAFFSDSSDRNVSIAMHRILDEEVRKETL